MKEIGRESPPLDEEPEEGGGVVEGETVLVPEGEYELRYVDYETRRYYGSPKVVVRFSIVEPEKYASSPVERFYNAKKLTGPPGRFGSYVATIRGDLFREFNRIAGRAERPDRISFARLKNRRIIGAIETVRIDHNRAELPRDDQYSRIACLVRVLPGEDW